jgi:hypothetical protein
MASTYSALKIELIGTGEQSGTWGTTTNTNLGDTALGEAITGSADVTFASGTVTLTLTDTNASQIARNLRLNLTGTSGGAQNLIVPNIEKLYLVNNGCADAITVKNSSGTGIAVPAGKSMFVFNTGANVVDAVTHATSLTLGSALPVASGGTGVTTSTGTTNVVLSASPTLTGTPLAPTASPGTNTTQIASTAFVGAAVTAATGALGTMSTQNANTVAITGGAINGTTIGATTPSTGAFTTLNANAVTTLGETTTVSATAATGTINYDVKTQGVVYYTSNASGNWTVNFRGDGSTTLNTLMAVGETRTVTFMVTQGATAYYNSAVTIDGVSVTPKWQGGAAPTNGNTSSIDIYTYSIIKTVSATYTVFASQSRFA